MCWRRHPIPARGHPTLDDWVSKRFFLGVLSKTYLDLSFSFPSYNLNGKSFVQEARTSPFSLLQQQPGLFTITSIAHQQKMCKAAVTDLRFKVHALPSAQVGHGKKIFQDIHEGDQAEIVFTLIGEPPFTFTYQRSELSPKKGGIGKVLETHTVSRIQTNEYSIFSALEGLSKYFYFTENIKLKLLSFS